MVALRWLDRAASITVTTVMLSTTVTPSAITSAKPRWSCSTLRKRFFSRPVIASDPRAVPKEDGVHQFVGADARSLHTDREVDLKRGKTEAPGDVREGRKDGADRQIVRHLHAGGVAGGPRRPVQPVTVGEARNRRRTPADVAAATSRD